MFQNYFQISWKGFTRQYMPMKNANGRNDVQCPFIHQSCKPDFTEHRRGAVCAQRVNVIPRVHFVERNYSFFLIISHFASRV